MFCLSTYLRHILAAQALLCILLGYLFLNLAFAMRRNCSIWFIVICCEWFVASLCAVGSHRTLYGKGGRPPSSSLYDLWTYYLHYLYSLCGVCRWLLPHIPRKGWSHPTHSWSSPYISWCAFSKLSLYCVIVDHLLDVQKSLVLKEIKVLL